MVPQIAQKAKELKPKIVIQVEELLAAITTTIKECVHIKLQERHLQKKNAVKARN